MQIKNLSWREIEAAYGTLSAETFTKQLERAEFLLLLKTEEPWKDRKRYESTAAYEEFSELSWPQILTRLHENLLEVNNTIRILQVFGAKDFQRYGRAQLLRLLNRTTDKHVHERVFAKIRAVKITKRTAGTATMQSVLDSIIPRAGRRALRGKGQEIQLVRALKTKNAKLVAENKKLRIENKTLRVANGKLQQVVKNAGQRATAKIKALKLV